MKRILSLLTFTATLLASVSHAALITVDPDDYAEGTLLTGATPGVNIYTSDGGNVYASQLFGRPSRPDPEGFVHSGPIGDRVFSSAVDYNSEWIHMPLDLPWNPDSVYSLLAEASGVMVFEFLQPVDYISLLAIELYSDAGWGSEPQSFWVFDATGSLLTFRDGPDSRTTLPSTLEPPEFNPYSYYQTTFSLSGMRYLVAGGQSEPTTFDRLQFNTATTVPEPSSLLLLVAGIVGFYGHRLSVCWRDGNSRL